MGAGAFRSRGFKKLMGGAAKGYSVRCSSIRDIQELRNVSGSGMKLSNEA